MTVKIYTAILRNSDETISVPIAATDTGKVYYSLTELYPNHSVVYVSEDGEW